MIMFKPTKECQYGISVKNGQRIFAPIDKSFYNSDIYDQEKNHEVFIDKLPNDLYEDELIPFLCQIGPIYQLRILMNFTGKSKGKAFVIFENVHYAYMAVEKLDQKLIRPNHQPIKVSFSANNKRLHLNIVPKHFTDLDLMKLLTKYLKGIEKIKLFESKTYFDMNEAIVTFGTHQLAASARRIFISGYITYGKLVFSADWAKPKDFQTLFIKTLGHIDEKTILQLFSNETCKIRAINYRRSPQTFNKSLSSTSSPSSSSRSSSPSSSTSFPLFGFEENVFIKYQTFKMANHVSKICSTIEFPKKITGLNAFILKVSWPDRN